MAAKTFGLPALQELPLIFPDPCFISGADLNDLIEYDVGGCDDFCSQDAERHLNYWNSWISPWGSNYNRSDAAAIDQFQQCETRSILGYPEDSPKEWWCLVDPKTAMPRTYQVKEDPKPYHPHQDHDYLKKPTEDDGWNKGLQRECQAVEIKKEDEPTVEVWEIDNFCKRQPTKEPRRTSARTRIIKEREQARKITNAVQAALKNKNARRIRQCKNIKPKNSVETTPSQSDIEECYSYPVRPLSIKITKKKTSKGRIDHSESERHRREVLRSNFSSLCEVVPNQFLRGEKVTSQISKQKILNGAKSYITELNSSKSSYKPIFRLNDILKEKMRKKLKRKMHKIC